MIKYVLLLVKIILILLFLGCLLPMEYEYFQFVRVVGMISFSVLAFDANSKKEKYWFIIWLLSAIAINPIIKIPLGRFYWNIIDVIWSVLLLISIFISSKEINFSSSNTTMKESQIDNNKKLKKFIAREILVLFSSVCFVILAYVVLNLWNSYNINRKDNYFLKYKEINSKISSTPKDTLKLVYDVVKDNFVENYIVNKQKYAIPKKEEREFLNEFSNARKVEGYSLGYSYFKVHPIYYFLHKNNLTEKSETEFLTKYSNVKSVKEIHLFYITNNLTNLNLDQFFSKYFESSNINETYDSIIEFDYVDFLRFKTLISQQDYCRLFYETFDTLLPFSSFDSFMKISQNSYYDSIEIHKLNLLAERDNIQSKLSSINDRIFPDKDLRNMTIDLSYIILFVLYPLRLLIFILIWAFKNVS
jgi:hypothetical protein